MNNSTTTSLNYGNETKTEYYEIAIQAAFLLLVLAVSLVGNGFVCSCILKDKRLQCTSNYFIFSLSSADFFFALFCLPLRIYHILRGYKWDLGLVTCQIWVWLDFFFCSASIANLAAISVDRYYKISSPMLYDRRMTKTKVTWIIVSLWGYSAVLASLSPVEWSSTPKHHARGTVVENGACFNDSNIYLTIVSAIGFCVPLATMLLMYCVVFKVAVCQASKLVRQHESLYNKKKRRKSPSYAISLFFEVKATKTLIILLSAFCICWCPFFTLIFIGLYSPRHFNSVSALGRKVMVVLFVNIFPNCNAALDPIIYTTQNQQFKRVIEKLLTRLKVKTTKSGSRFSDGYSETRKSFGTGLLGSLV